MLHLKEKMSLRNACKIKGVVELKLKANLVLNRMKYNQEK